MVQHVHMLPKEMHWNAPKAQHVHSNLNTTVMQKPKEEHDVSAFTVGTQQDLYEVLKTRPDLSQSCKNVQSLNANPMFTELQPLAIQQY